MESKPTIVEQEISEKRDTIRRWEQAIGSCVALLDALALHTKGTINKTFFETHFPVSNEFRTWTKYSLVKPEYSFERYAFRILLDGRERVEVQDRSKAELVRAITEKRAQLAEWIREYEGKIAALSGLDEDGLRRDLLAVFEKHGKPSIWRHVLDSYEIKYPKTEEN